MVSDTCVSGSISRSHAVLALDGGIILVVCLVVVIPGLLRRIFSHAFEDVRLPTPWWYLRIELATSFERIAPIGGVFASTSRTGPATARYAPSTVLRLLFWRVSSFLSTPFRAFTDPCGIYQMLALYVSTGLTTDEYMIRALLKLAPHVNIII